MTVKICCQISDQLLTMMGFLFPFSSDPDDDDIEDGMLDSEQWDRCYVEKMIPEYFSVKLN